jgi:hypothetical protein
MHFTSEQQSSSEVMSTAVIKAISRERIVCLGPGSEIGVSIRRYMSKSQVSASNIENAESN